MKAMILSDFIVMRRYLVQVCVTCLIVSLPIAMIVNTSLAGIGACFGAMVPMLYLFPVAAYDELNDWQTYRLTLPVSRREVILGRYLSLLAVALTAALLGVIVSYLVGAAVDLTGTGGARGPSDADASSEALFAGLALASNPPEAIWGSGALGAAMALLMGAIVLPIIARVGMTKSARYFPVVVVLIMLTAFIAFGEDGPLSGYVPEVAKWLLTSDSAVGILVALFGLGMILVYGASLLIAIRSYASREF